MLIWVAAMHCEAKPVIDFYRLKKSRIGNGFDLYEGEQMSCVISGIGKVAAAAACAWAAALNRKQDSLAWINIVIAGSAQDALGTAFWLNKITDCDSDRSFYPVPLVETLLEPTHCLTLNQASSEYQAQGLFDMEASAFFDTATRFSSAELVQSIKIVSDNEARQTGRDKSRVSQLVAQNIESLTQFAQSLLALNNLVAANNMDASNWQQLIERTRFSQTQKSQLKKSVQFLLSQNYSIETLTDEISESRSAQEIITHLKQLCLQTSRNL